MGYTPAGWQVQVSLLFARKGLTQYKSFRFTIFSGADGLRARSTFAPPVERSLLWRPRTVNSLAFW